MCDGCLGNPDAMNNNLVRLIHGEIQSHHGSTWGKIRTGAKPGNS